MGMVVRSNIMAVNANRQLGINNSQVSKSLEKLASGFKINRAGDDASGLAISEKMKAQIKGLDTASANSQDGISLIQTAEGALTEVHDMLGRMVELAGKAANGTMDKNVDRASIQKEVDALKAEIDRVSQSTNFNGIKLLDGSLSSSGSKAPAAANPNGSTAVALSGDLTTTDKVSSASKFTTASAAASTAAGNVKMTVKYMDADGSAKEKVLTIALGASDNAAAVAGKYKAAIDADEDLSKLFDVNIATDKLEITSKTTGAGAPKITSAVGVADTATGGTISGTGATQVDGTDRSVRVDVSGIASATTAPTNGSLVTIGGKTYEFLDDVSKAKEGNVAVQISAGTNKGAETLDNLVTALKANGVTSASLVKAADASATNTDATGIVIGDLSQISVAQEGVEIGSESDGVLVKNTTDIAGSYKATAQLGTAGDHKLTIEYLDDKGQKQSAVLDYTLAAGALTNADVATAMVDAIKKDSSLSALFDAKVGTGGAFELTAKDSGTEGARLIGVKNDEGNQGTNGMTGGIEITKEAKDAGRDIQLTGDLKDGDTVTIDGKTYEFLKDPSKVKDGNIAIAYKAQATGVPNAADLKDISKNLAAALKSNGADMNYDAANGIITFKSDAASASGAAGGLTLQIGDTGDAFNQVTVSVNDMSTKGLKIDTLDVSTREAASAAQKLLKDTETGGGAINSVSSTRADLGALQNRLEHTINNLDVSSENMNSANSRVRDTDMAKQMMEYTKQNVLTQAAQAMLAQANQQPQSVLQLLQ